jgi:hypothetical protein
MTTPSLNVNILVKLDIHVSCSEIVLGKEVTKQLVFDGLCNVNAKFILRV